MLRRAVWVLWSMAFLLASAACGPAPGTGPLTFEQATQLVLDEVVQPDQLARPLIVFGLSQPLEVGDRIHPYEKRGFEPFPSPTTVDAPTWFFWIDDAPGAMYAHPNRFVFVAQQSGEVTVQDQEWWPVLNREGLWTAQESYWDAENWLFSFEVNPPAPPDENASPQSVTGLDGLALQTQSPGSALVINGWESGETLQQDMADSSDLMHDILSEAGFDTTYLGPKEDGNPDRDGEATAEQRFGWLHRKAREMRPSQTLFLYITGHGGVDKKGNGVVGSVFEDLLTDTLMGFDPGVHIIVVIDSCHSGSFTNSLTSVADVTITSTDQASAAYGDIDNMGGKQDSNPGDRGLEYTSGFVEDWKSILADPDESQRVRDRAKQQGFNFWESLAPASHLSAVEKDLANNLGWTGPILVYGQPQTRIRWTPTPTPVSLPQPGDTRTYQSTATVKEDQAGHDGHILMPSTLPLDMVWTLSGIKIDAASPWVEVDGTLAEDGSIEASGQGVVAGYPGIAVSFEGTLDGDALVGVYGMGVKGGLPSGLPIYYDIEGQAEAAATATPTPSTDSLPAVQSFYKDWNAAFEAQDVDTLFSLLHPTVLDVYGADVCRAYLESVIRNPVSVTVQGATDLPTWEWQADDRQVSVDEAVAVDAAVTAGGQTVDQEVHLAWDESSGNRRLAWFTDCGQPLPLTAEVTPSATASQAAATATLTPEPNPTPTGIGAVEPEAPAASRWATVLPWLGLLGLVVLAILAWRYFQERQWRDGSEAVAGESFEVQDSSPPQKTEAECDKPCKVIRAAIRQPKRIRIIKVEVQTLHKYTGKVIDTNVIPGRLADKKNVMNEFGNQYDVPKGSKNVGKEFIYRKGRCKPGCHCVVPAGAKPSRHRRVSRNMTFTFIKSLVRVLNKPLTDPKTGQPVMPDPNSMKPEDLEFFLSDADLLLPRQPGQPYRVKTTMRYVVTLRVPLEQRMYTGRCKPIPDPSRYRNA
jgi:hypothetical protein